MNGRFQFTDSTRQFIQSDCNPTFTRFLIISRCSEAFEALGNLKNKKLNEHFLQRLKSFKRRRKRRKQNSKWIQRNNIELFCMKWWNCILRIFSKRSRLFSLPRYTHSDAQFLFAMRLTWWSNRLEKATSKLCVWITMATKAREVEKNKFNGWFGCLLSAQRRNYRAQ